MKSTIAKNYLYNIGYQILILLLPLLTTPYISRVLGANGVGAFGYTNSITQYFVLFGCIGLNLYGQREVAYGQQDLTARSKIFFELLLVRTGTVAVSLVIFVCTVCQSETYGWLFTIQLIEIVSSLVDVSWFFQGLEEFKKIVIRNALVKLSGVILIFTFVKEAHDLGIYTLIYGITLFLGNLSMWFYVPRFVRRVKICALQIRRHIKPALLLFVPQIATNIYNLLDKSMIGSLTQSDAEVAYYEQAQKIMKMALSLPTALGTVMLPRIASMFSQGKQEEIRAYFYQSIRFVCMLSFPLCLGLCGLSSGFVPWFFGDGYAPVVHNLRILSPIIVIVGISNVIGVQYLLPVGKQKQYTCSVILGTIVNFVLNLFLIPRMLSYGAAIASVLAEMAVTAFQLFAVKREFSIPQIACSVYKYVIGALIMCAVIGGISKFLVRETIWGTAAEILAGIVIYGAILLLLKDRMLLEFINKCRKKRLE